MAKRDTITAIATAPGRGGIGVLRVSGPDAGKIAQAITGRTLPPRQAIYSPFRHADGEIIDRGIALYFPGPASFTGENVLELQGHGGPAVLDRMLQATLAAGARAARPGEFSERAFINDKLDLAQAEAVADLIAADSHAAAGAAMRSLDGEFSRQVDELLQQLIELRVFVEAALDFPDEEIDFLEDGDVAGRAEHLLEKIRELLKKTKSGAALQEGLRVVIAGKPNAGKSSLLNRLAQRDVAIVTDIAGTTRDVLEQQINLEGLPLTLVDTAGLHEGSGDVIEQEGMHRARQQLAKAQHVLLLADDASTANTNTDELLQELNIPGDLPVTLLRNKCDLSGSVPGKHTEQENCIYLSALTGDGMDALTKHLFEIAGLQTGGSANFSARRRHLDALEQTAANVQNGIAVFAETSAGELLAQELLAAQQSLGEITGVFHNEDLLGAIFSSFCIGK